MINWRDITPLFYGEPLYLSTNHWSCAELVCFLHRDPQCQIWAYADSSIVARLMPGVVNLFRGPEANFSYF